MSDLAPFFGASLDPTLLDGVAARVDEAWALVDVDVAGRGARWTPQVTPLFPSAWPTGDRAAVAYVFAYGAEARVHATHLVAAPWAHIVVGGNDPGGPRVDVVEHQLRGLGRQGGRALTAAEQDAYAMSERVERAVLTTLRTGTLPDDDSSDALAVRLLYRTWLRHHGVVAKQIVPTHPAFVAWVQSGDAELS